MYLFIAKQFRKPSGLLGILASSLMKKGNIHAYNIIIKELSIESNDHVLEIGYGHGVGLNMICDKYDCKLSGIDFSKLMFNEAKKRNYKFILNKQLELKYGNYQDIVFDQNSFNKIFFINVIYFWKDLDLVFRKIYNELNPNGILLFYMAHPDDLNKLKFTDDSVFNKYTLEFVIDKLNCAGFKSIEQEFNHGYYIKCKK